LVAEKWNSTLVPMVQRFSLSMTDASKKLQADEVRENLWPIKFIHLFPERIQDDPPRVGGMDEWNMTRHVRSD
jgi:hypothetical protein